MPFRTGSGSNSYGLNIDAGPRSGALPGTRVVSTQNIRVYARLANLLTNPQSVTPHQVGDAWREIGAIQTLSYSNARTNNVVKQLGYGDVLQDLVPGDTTFTLTATRFLTYNKKFIEALGYTEDTLPAAAGQLGGFRSIAQITYPLEIRREIEVMVPQAGQPAVTDSTLMATDNLQKVITIFQECWVKGFSGARAVGGGTITETVDFAPTRVVRGSTSGA
jgi:hypothetical protein